MTSLNRTPASKKKNISFERKIVLGPVMCLTAGKINPKYDAYMTTESHHGQFYSGTISSLDNMYYTLKLLKQVLYFILKLHIDVVNVLESHTAVC